MYYDVAAVTMTWRLPVYLTVYLLCICSQPENTCISAYLLLHFAYFPSRAEIQGARAEIMAWIMVEFTAENNGGRICDCVYGALELICHACEHCMIDLPI